MENFLCAKGLWNLIKNGVEEPVEGTILSSEESEQLEKSRIEDHKVNEESEQLEKSRIEDHKVKHFLFRAIDRSIFEQILDRSTSQMVWDSLKRKYGGNDRVKKSMLNALRREFELLEMTEIETITEYFARVMAVANKMRSNGELMPDSKVVEKILRTLTPCFTYIVVSIEESKDTETMSIDELQSSLVVHEQKFKKVYQDNEQVLTSESSRGRGRGTYRGRGRGRGRQFSLKATVPPLGTFSV
ncbi:uncharacterized protein LOC111242482 [Vigna radiata var. radiata]|uniref:Uncharacterized protein LOC111242482 n=1 Tax=Vigna radiata var. radiata TaxID=3916 RepID=A0A3Q0FDA6_VIGRR|nr:uncharacterized protein LOC111242482 [Vigna radiata var. radiata]